MTYKNLEIQKESTLNYKDIDVLRRFIDEQGKILPRKITRLSVKEQKKITNAIKQARILAILPFTNQEI